ncbi:MAG: helix-turn-helix domain-containing protein [Candidatus Marinimicrobia bacterium]|nr:helix-turn-helix domain-containing protein [Candidatus Neomarinimicrobiota bacterium]MCF7828593.1 helix-turn-helix domain-containing protein [Candidatus Neomarinimicrobiota bacterium]MCF7880334.1 helix-turn-helix domain-containing protein [Candidatus Neomarinimicrobiota bacterium]
MSSEMKYFTSEEVSNILGVHVSSIKRWTDDGKLECIRTAGGHRKFLPEHLADFLERNEEKIQKANLFPIETESDLETSYHIIKGDYEYLSGQILDLALDKNREKIQKILNGLYLGQHPLHRIYDKVLTPALHEIGHLWENDQLSVIGEHFASQTIRDSIIRLQGSIKIPPQKKGTAFCLNFSSELHDIAIKMVDHILEEHGYRVLFSGQITPLFNIEKIFSEVNIDRLYVSSTYIQDINMIQFEINYLYEQCQKYDIRLYVGGDGFDRLGVDHPAIHSRLFTFEDVAETCRED